jgi:hypothetical protein
MVLLYRRHRIGLKPDCIELVLKMLGKVQRLLTGKLFRGGEDQLLGG